MKKNIIITCFLYFVFLSNIFAQHSTFFDVDDNRERGYHTRPYLRYEAENGSCQTNGTFIGQALDFDQRNIQSEASNQQALQLINVGDYVEWENDEAADGMVIRFSIPDNAQGTGTLGTLKLYVNDVFIQEITLNSKWAWQYILKTGNQKYPYNVPASDKFPRMRFDEVRIKLDDKIPVGEKFKLEKADAGEGAYTIDFVELEPIPAKVDKPASGDVVEYIGDGSDLASFVSDNAGKIIYIPSGKYDVPKKLQINGDNTKLMGAGMWYTQLHFTADPSYTTNPNGYSQRGIQSSASNVEVSGLFLTTENERRYADYISRQVGKGFNGSFGTNSVINDVWVTHFECGAWIEATNGLHISNSRFRNNYADGINLARASQDAVVEYCSFRNNGDDDMASWSRSLQATINNTFQFNTSENNWRAAGIGFFGGKQNKALNCVIVDPIESAIRVNNDFSAAAFSEEGYFEIRNMSIYQAGDKQGEVGQAGNLWGHRTGAIFINSSSTVGKYDVNNLLFSDIDIYDSKGDAIIIKTGTSWAVRNVTMENITVDRAALSTAGNSWAYYGLYVDGSNGINNFICVDFLNMGDVPEKNVETFRGFLIDSNCEENTRIVRVGETIDLGFFIPKDFSNNLEFSVTSGENFISVDEDGVVIGKNEGTAQIKVLDKNNLLNTITYTIIVREVAVTGVSISNETLTLKVGDTYQLTATVEPGNATYKSYSWSSSKTSVATVLVTGKVTARSPGTANITVTTADGKHTKTCVVTVLDTSNDIIVPETDELSIIAYGDVIQISGYEKGEIVSIYNLLGVKVYSKQLTGEGALSIQGLCEGVYIVAAEKARARQKVIIHKK